MPSHRPTSFDVAQKAGVSRSTVSFVLNDAPGVSISESTRQRVLDAAKSLNYHPHAAGRKLASGKSNTIGLVLRQSPEQVFADAFLARVIFGVEQAAFENGFHVLLKQVDIQDSDGYLRLISENQVDGIVLSGPRQDDLEIIAVNKQDIPILLLGQIPGSDIPFVDVDAEAGAATAVQHLIDQGHKAIGMITNARISYTSAQQRRNGYLQALKKAGLESQPGLIREGNFTPASGYQAMTDLLKVAKKLTAVFVASDVVALGALLAIKHAGLRIPEDIAVVGFDDIPLAQYFDPPLTTICLPAYDLGWEAGKRLLHLVKKGTLDQSGVLLDTSLIIRDSSQVHSRTLIPVS